VVVHGEASGELEPEAIERRREAGCRSRSFAEIFRSWKASAWR
jgi:hypothetical protein